MLASLQLLIVEDNLADVKLLEKALTSQSDYEIKFDAVERLSELEDLLSQKEYDLCLLDLSLPDSFGLETISNVRKISSSIPIVVLTGQNDQTLGTEVLKSGAQDYLPKANLETEWLFRSIFHAIERKQMSLELEAKNKELSDFATIASHDLKAPLSRILMLHKLLELEESSPSFEENSEIIEKISEQISEMGKLIDSLLEYARAMNKPLELEKASLSQVIDVAYENIEKEVLDASAKLTVGDLPEMNMDLVLMTQVFQNILSNSIKYRSEANPIIAISSELKGDEIELCIVDNGRGLTSEQSKAIFTPFRRFVRADQVSGSGIGMTVCQKNIERHLGKIWVESKGEGQGIQIYIRLPIDLKV